MQGHLLPGLDFSGDFFEKAHNPEKKQNIRSDVLLFSGTPDWSRTSGLTLRRYVCRIACDVLTYTAVHFDHAAAIIHISYCAIRSTLGAFYNQSNR